MPRKQLCNKQAITNADAPNVAMFLALMCDESGRCCVCRNVTPAPQVSCVLQSPFYSRNKPTTSHTHTHTHTPHTTLHKITTTYNHHHHTMQVATSTNLHECTSVNTWLVEEITTSASYSRWWQHGCKSCVHTSKCGSWYKKNTTASASVIFALDAGRKSATSGSCGGPSKTILGTSRDQVIYKYIYT